MISTYRLEDKLEKDKKDRVLQINTEKSLPQQNGRMEEQARSDERKNT
jgi:hypothetical protein